MSIFSILAEQRIEEAQARGEFDHLPGAGKPLEFEDDSAVPEDLRMAYKVLRNAGFVPPEIADRKEIGNLLDMLEKGGDERECVAGMRRLKPLVLHLRRSGRSAALEEHDEYYRKILQRMARLEDEF